jgi:uncharacterized protein (TIGR03437 family)
MKMKRNCPIIKLGLLFALTVSILGSGGSIAGAPVQTQTITNPNIYRIEPHTVLAGGGDLVVQIAGSGFINESAVRVNGSGRETTFVSSTRLAARLTAADIARAGSARVTVFNPTTTSGYNSRAEELRITGMNMPWNRTSGPEAGTITALASDGEFLFAGTQTNGVMRSTDRGRTWSRVNNGLTENYINALAAANGAIFAGGFNGGVFRSLDRGETWSAFNSGIYLPNIQMYISALATDGWVVYAASNNRILRSDLLGEEWTVLSPTETHSFNDRPTSLAIIGANLFVGTDGGGVHRYNSETKQWAQINRGLGGLRVFSLATADGHLFASAGSSGVYRSADLGENWTAARNGLPAEFGSAIIANGTTLFYGTQGRAGVYYSTDLGHNWQQAGKGLTSTRVHALAAIDEGVFAGTNGGGVFRLDGMDDDWAAANRGLRASWVTALAESGGQIFAGMFDGGMARSSDNGRTWTPVNKGLAHRFILSTAANDQVVFAGTNGGGLFRSTDRGENWSAANNGLPGVVISSVFVIGPVAFAQTGSGLFRSTDNGQNWSRASSGLPTNSYVNDMAFFNGSIYAALDEGVYQSTTNGSSWRSASHALPTQPIVSLAVVGSWLYAGTGPFSDGTPGGIYRFTNNGLGWIQVRAALSNIDRSAVTSIEVAGSKMIAVAGRGGSVENVNSGVYLSSDQGRTWELITLGLPYVSTTRIVVSGSTVLAGTTGQGVFSNDLNGNALATASAASFSSASLAVESIAAAFGSGFADRTEVATELPLPVSLAGARVVVTDNAGIERDAPLFFVSPGQINFQVPAGTMPGPATVTVLSESGRVSAGAATIAQVSPGIFAANSDGRGVPAAVLLRVRADGSQSYEPVAQYDEATKRFTALPIDMTAPNEELYLIVFCTGLRYRSMLSAVSAQIGGANVQALYAGPQGSLAGLDQLNLRLPRSLAGRGEVDLAVRVNGAAANTMKIAVK